MSRIPIHKVKTADQVKVKGHPVACFIVILFVSERVTGVDEQEVLLSSLLSPKE